MGVWGGGGGGGGGGLPSEAEDLLKKKIKRNEGFSFKVIFFTFLHCSLNPQNYELTPQIPEKINSAPQLPENK